MIILGIETSCDETATSIVEIKNNTPTVLSNIISSQIALHAKWGGVVPNLAAREHLKNILPVIETALKEANKSPSEIDLISVTQGPGLIPALLIGTTTAKTLSYLWQKPMIGIHHIEGHIYANFIAQKINTTQFPILCLVVSGGHTQLVLMQKHLQYEIIGETVDDAVGEAFDKVARILNLSYPGGPKVAEIADTRNKNKTAKKFHITLPRPMLKSKNFNFSFSGIKTAVLYASKKDSKNLQNADYIAEMCQEFQTAVTEVLIDKTIRAGKKYNVKTILLAGGVSANIHLRETLKNSVAEKLTDTTFSVPNFSYSLDNASMIAMAGYYRWKNLKDKKILKETWREMKTRADLKMVQSK